MESLSERTFSERAAILDERARKFRCERDKTADELARLSAEILATRDAGEPIKGLQAARRRLARRWDRLDRLVSQAESGSDFLVDWMLSIDEDIETVEDVVTREAEEQSRAHPKRPLNPDLPDEYERTFKRILSRELGRSPTGIEWMKFRRQYREYVNQINRHERRH